MTQGFYEQLGLSTNASASAVREAYASALARLKKRRAALVEQGGDTLALDHARTLLDEAFTVLNEPQRRRRYDALLVFQERAGAFGQVDADALWSQVMGALVPPSVAAAHELLRVSSNLKVGELPPAPRPGGAPSHEGFFDADTSVGTSPTAVPDEATFAGVTARLPRAGGPAYRAPHEDDDGDVTTPAARVSPLAPSTPAPAPTSSGRPAGPTSSGRPAGLASAGRPVGLAMPRPSFSSEGPPSHPGAEVVSLARPVGPESRPELKVVDGMPSASSVIVLNSQPSPVKEISAEEVARLVDSLGYSGGLLKSVRDARGLSLQDVADATRISVRYLESIEADSYDALPSATFVRGYVREMARMLQLDEAEVVAGYMRRMQG